MTTDTRSATFTMTRTIPADFETTVAATRAALGAAGFGIITEIDMAATLKDKLGVEVGDQIILGACNPSYAHRATELVPSVAAMLPCNVVVRARDRTTTVVEMFDPAVMASLSQDPELEQVAAEVRRDLAGALHAIATADA